MESGRRVLALAVFTTEGCLGGAEGGVLAGGEEKR